MKYSTAIQIIEYVNQHDGALSLDPEDPSYDWLEAMECVRRHDQRRRRKGEMEDQASSDLELHVTSNLEPRSGVSAWEASPLTGVVGPIVETLLVAEGAVR